MNPLNEYPQIRKYLYMFQWVVNLILALAGAYFAVTQTALDALPQWYVVTLALAPILWAYLGLTAQSNVEPTNLDRYDEPDDGLSYEESGGQAFPEDLAFPETRP